MDITFTVVWKVYNNAYLRENLQIKVTEDKFTILAWKYVRFDSGKALFWICLNPALQANSIVAHFMKGENLKETFLRSRCIYFTSVFIYLHNDSI